MARVEWSEGAVFSLDRLILTHSLPGNTRARVRQSRQHLKRFPRLGPELETTRRDELRFVLGPWRWLVIIYVYLESEDRVVIVSVEDGRSATAARRRGG